MIALKYSRVPLYGGYLGGNVGYYSLDPVPVVGMLTLEIHDSCHPPTF